MIEIANRFHLLSDLKRWMQAGWGQEPSGSYPITSGVPSGNNERLHCFASFLLSRSVPGDDKHIFPFLQSFSDIIMFVFVNFWKPDEQRLLCPLGLCKQIPDSEVTGKFPREATVWKKH